jgi:hypothetical protein
MGWKTKSISYAKIFLDIKENGAKKKKKKNFFFFDGLSIFIFFKYYY